MSSIEISSSISKKSICKGSSSMFHILIVYIVTFLFEIYPLKRFLQDGGSFKHLNYEISLAQFVGLIK